MGKYVKKSKIVGSVAAMEVSPQSCIGVRTRAKTLAFQRLQDISTPTVSDASSFAYLQLRSRRIEKPSVLVEAKEQPKGCCRKSHEPNNLNMGLSMRMGLVKSGSMGTLPTCKGKSQVCVGNNVNWIETEKDMDVGVEGSLGENCLEFEGRDSEQSPSMLPKAQWNDTNTKVLLQLLAEEIRAGNRVNGVFNAQAWRNIRNKFLLLTGLPYKKNQLKNRSSQLQSVYSKWVKLSNCATGLGFDSASGTITADDDWWATQAEEDIEVYKWKSCLPKFLDLMYECYAGTFATGKYAYVPSYVPHVSLDLLRSQSQTNDSHTSSFSPTNKRSRDSTLRRSLGAELSAAVGEIANILKEKHAKMEAALDATDPELEDFDIAYNLLKDQPYIELASDFHLKAIKMLRDKICRHAFVNYVSKFPAEAQVKWFKCNFS